MGQKIGHRQEKTSKRVRSLIARDMGLHAKAESFRDRRERRPKDHKNISIEIEDDFPFEDSYEESQ